MPTIGENIKHFRKERGYTQEQLGSLCEPPMAASAIRRYESGRAKPKIETQEKIAIALNIKISDLNNTFSELQDIETKASLLLSQGSIARKANIYFGEGAEDLLYAYDFLNDKGKSEAIIRVAELTQLKQYAKNPDCKKDPE